MLPILLTLFLATSSLPVNQPYVQFMSNEAALLLPVTASTTDALIDFDAQIYSVDPALMRGIIKRESNFNQYAVGDHGTSVGLVQIHLPAHTNVSRAEAESPVFAINFLADQLSKGNCKIWSTCAAAKAAILSPPPVDDYVADYPHL